MPERLKIKGERYSRLVVREFHSIKWGKSLWLCDCDCGNAIVVPAGSLRKGDTKSCGCLCSELTTAKNLKHGFAYRGKQTKTYKIWQGMHSRCRNESATGYENYGGKGIKVCEEWKNYEIFLKDMGECPEEYSIERKNVKEDYMPSNCFWLPRKLQARNKTNTAWLTIGDETKKVVEWAEILGMSRSTLYSQSRSQRPLII